MSPKLGRGSLDLLRGVVSHDQSVTAFCVRLSKRRNVNSFRLLCAISLCAFLSERSALAGFITSYADVNILVGPYTQTSHDPNSTVSEIAVSGGAAGLSTASTDINLGAVGVSAGQGLSYNAGGSAGYSWTYSVAGDPSNTPIPLTFNFSLSGILVAFSGPDGTSSANVQFDVQTATQHVSAEAALTSHDGEESEITTGKFEDTGISLHSPLDPQYTLKVFDAPISIEDTSVGVHALVATLTTGATSSPGAFAESAYAATGTPGSDSFFTLDSFSGPGGSTVFPPGFSGNVILSSVTVPASFNAIDVSALSVHFDSGMSMPVTVAAPNAVPEPSAGVLACAAALLLSVYGRRAWSRPRGSI